MGRAILFKVTFLCEPSHFIQIQDIDKSLNEDDFKNQPDDLYDLPQEVIDKYENNGVTIDQGGAEDDLKVECEFNFPDGCESKDLSTTIDTARSFLNDLFEAYEKAGYKFPT